MGWLFDLFQTVSTAIVSFVLLAISYEYMNDKQLGVRPSTEPHTLESEQKEQNVTFVDDEPGDEHDYGSTIDSLRLQPMVTDASLEEFFSRPIRIGSIDWATAADLNVSYYPWEAYFANPRVVNRIANYKLMSAELCVKCVINGNPFTYGKAIVAYTPFSGYDDLSRYRAIKADLVGLSQRPHVYLDPSTSQGGCLSLPFTWWENCIDITSDRVSGTGTTDFKRMGQLDLKSINTLKHANGATDQITVNIYVWAKNVKLAVPTLTEPAAITPQGLTSREEFEPQGDEYTGEGIISKPATAVANYLSRVKAPVIQPYITATKLAASTVGAIASLFGYSRPTLLQSSRLQPNTKHNMAVSNLEDDVAKLSLDSKQELTIDPSAYGLSTKDEMDINFIASRESYWTTFNWAVGRSQEEMLWNAIVDPMVPIKYSGGGETEIHCPAITFAAMPFNRWRGSIKYRFQVVCSKFHRGRLKVVYDPSGTGTQAEYNTAYTSIIDISNTTDFTITAGWGQSTTYRKMFDITSPQNLYIDDTPLFYDSYDEQAGNGTISVYVVTELAVPNTTIDNDIQINVFISAGDDFEVAMPTGERVTRLRLRQPSEITPQGLTSREQFEPHGMDTMPLTPASDSAGTSEHPTVVSDHAALIPHDDPANLMHFGESIRSFRQLIKRYNAHEWITPWGQQTPSADGRYIVKIQRPALPFEPGYSPKVNITQTTRVPRNIGTTPNARGYAYSIMTLLRYLTTGYVGWRGSVRYLVDTSTLACTCTATGPLTVTRYSECAPETESAIVNVPYTNQGQQQRMVNYDDASGQEGFIVQNVLVNPTTAFEVPYYSEKRFSPARNLTNFDLVGPNYGPCWKLRMPIVLPSAGDSLVKVENSQLSTFVAAGEDFSVGFFVGAPIFYYEGIPPT